MPAYDSDLRLEGSPTDDQKDRLEGFLTELMLISRKYGILVDGYVEERPAMLDLSSDKVIGLGLMYCVDDTNKIVGYDCDDSILDGVWLVDTPEGPQEQRQVRARPGDKLTGRKPPMKGATRFS